MHGYDPERFWSEEPPPPPPKPKRIDLEKYLGVVASLVFVYIVAKQGISPAMLDAMNGTHWRNDATGFYE